MRLSRGWFSGSLVSVRGMSGQWREQRSAPAFGQSGAHTGTPSMPPCKISPSSCRIRAARLRPSLRRSIFIAVPPAVPDVAALYHASIGQDECAAVNRKCILTH